MEAFNRKMERIKDVAYPVIKDVQEHRGNMFERIIVPVTDGKRTYNIPCDLREAYDTECKSVVKQFEKVILLHVIDDNWKEHLRQLDELRHSVQNASYEQKDPLLIFKLESAKLWDDMINDMNNRIAQVLMRGQIPEVQQEVREAAPEQRSQRYNEQKIDLTNSNQPSPDLVDPNQQAAAHTDTRGGMNRAPQAPIIKDKMPNRNDPCPCGSGKKFKNCHGRGL
ncbi:MAG: SEC-C domain-containing protein [Prevotella sp.]|nr:SEC-C domain-containing protein [Prevotella sp.]